MTDRERKDLFFGAAGCVAGLVVGGFGLLLGVSFLLTDIEILGLGGAYYGVSGLVIGFAFLAVSFLLRGRPTGTHDD